MDGVGDKGFLLGNRGFLFFRLVLEGLTELLTLGLILLYLPLSIPQLSPDLGIILLQLTSHLCHLLIDLFHLSHQASDLLFFRSYFGSCLGHLLIHVGYLGFLSAFVLDDLFLELLKALIDLYLIIFTPIG